MEKFFTPNEERFFAESDSATIQNAIAAAEADGCREVHIPRYNARMDRNEWRISETIRIPSSFTVILDNCYMVQETGVIANMFANSRFDDLEYITKLENEQHDITVLGRGNAICDGGVHNGLLEKTSGYFGYFNIWRNNMFFWANVNGLRMENVRVENHRFWALNHVYCRNVHLKNISFYAVPHVPNMDGIDLRAGCNNFVIENITGRTGDDVLALTDLPLSKYEALYRVEGKEIDIHDVRAHNLKADPYTQFVTRLLNQDGAKLYNIELDTLMDSSDYRTKKRPLGTVGIGSTSYFQKRAAQRGETCNIRVSNITARGNSALRLSNTVADAEIRNVQTFGDNVDGINLFNYCDFHNVTVDDFSYAPHQSEIFTSRALPPEKFNGTVFELGNASGDIAIRGVKIGEVKRIFNLGGPIRVTLGKCECKFANTQIQISGAAKLIREEE